MANCYKCRRYVDDEEIIINADNNEIVMCTDCIDDNDVKFDLLKDEGVEYD